MSPSDSERLIYRDYDDNPRPLPPVEEIRRLVDEDPVVVVSFCQQLYRSDVISTEEKCVIAVELLSKVEPRYRDFVWQALSGMIRVYIGPPIPLLYDLAKETLESPLSTDDEKQAVRSFLGDLRCHYTEYSHFESAILSLNAHECEQFVGLSVLSRYKKNLLMISSILQRFAAHESFLMRESVLEAVANLNSRQDLPDKILFPFLSSFEEITRTACLRPHWYLIEGEEYADEAIHRLKNSTFVD